MVNQMEKQILKYNFQKLNFTILFTLSFFFIYLFPILDLINTITRNDITLEQKQTDLVMWIIVWVVVYFVVTLIGFIFILISKIDKKWKIILSIFWILFKPIYMIIYCVKFKVIFSKYIENLSNINDEMTNKTSIYSFVLLNLFVIFSIIVIIFSSVLINKSTNEIVVEVFSILDLIVIIGYFFAFTKSIYCSLIKSNNSYIKRIPILFSFIWIFSKIKNKNQINN